MVLLPERISIPNREAQALRAGPFGKDRPTLDIGIKHTADYS